MVQNIDYAPTFLAAAGLEPDWKVHGLSLMPLLAGETPDDWRDTLYYRYIDGGHGVPKHSAIRTNDFKLLYFDDPRNEAETENRWELFDLHRDPQEMTNLIANADYAKQVAELKERFWKTRTFYGDTDEEAWKRGGGNRFPADAYFKRRK